MSVATLETKISAAEKKSKILLAQKKTWQEDVDSLLDRMNELGKLLSSVQQLLISLTFEIERDFSDFKKSDIASTGIKEVTTAVSKLLAIVRKSELFPGVKSTYYLLKTENSYLKELLLDKNVSIQLEADEEMQSIVEASIKLLHKKTGGQ